MERRMKSKEARWGETVYRPGMAMLVGLSREASSLIRGSVLVARGLVVNE